MLIKTIMQIHNLRKIFIDDESGVILYMSIVTLGFVFFVAFGLSFILIKEIRITGQTKDSAIAFSAAESGVENILFNINTNDGNCDSRSNLSKVDLEVCMDGASDFNDCPVNYSKYRIQCYALQRVSEINDVIPTWCIPRDGKGDRIYDKNDNTSIPSPPYTNCVRVIGEYGSSTRALQILYDSPVASR